MIWALDNILLIFFVCDTGKQRSLFRINPVKQSGIQQSHICLKEFLFWLFRTLFVFESSSYTHQMSYTDCLSRKIEPFYTSYAPENDFVYNKIKWCSNNTVMKYCIQGCVYLFQMKCRAHHKCLLIRQQRYFFIIFMSEPNMNRWCVVRSLNEHWTSSSSPQDIVTFYWCENNEKKRKGKRCSRWSEGRE